MLKSFGFRNTDMPWCERDFAVIALVWFADTNLTNQNQITSSQSTQLEILLCNECIFVLVRRGLTKLSLSTYLRIFISTSKRKFKILWSLHGRS